MHEIVPCSCLGDQPTAGKMARLLKEDVSAECWCPVTFPRKGAEMILTYDEHVLNFNYKFGILYQKYVFFKFDKSLPIITGILRRCFRMTE